MTSSQILITRLEQQVLDEYASIARNLDEMTAAVQRLSAVQPHLLAELRPLERKFGLVLTLFHASVFSVYTERRQQSTFDEETRQ